MSHITFSDCKRFPISSCHAGQLLAAQLRCCDIVSRPYLGTRATQLSSGKSKGRLAKQCWLSLTLSLGSWHTPLLTSYGWHHENNGTATHALHHPPTSRRAPALKLLHVRMPEKSVCQTGRLCQPSLMYTAMTATQKKMPCSVSAWMLSWIGIHIGTVIHHTGSNPHPHHQPQLN